MKTCIGCGETKELEEFPPNKSNKTDGHHARCKICYRLYQKGWRDANPGKNGEYSKKWRDENPEARKAYEKEYAENNREKLNAKQRKWNQKNPEKRRESNKQQYANQRKWAKENPQVIALNALVRRRTVRQAQPAWISTEQLLEIKTIYRSAKTMSEFHEEPYHVDHIEPIKGVNAEGEHVSCGLHVPWNLQILPASENIRKSNKMTTN